MSAENAVIDRPTTKNNFTLPDSGFEKKESLPNISSINNERANTNIPILDPLPDAKDSYGFSITADEFKPLFAYLSRTRQLETGTAKTEYLQKIADRMTRETNIKSRVVVMQKGESKEGFCTEEGTIFLSQSLLNCPDSVDEIAAVIAHETSHLLNHTGQMKRQTWNKLGVAWPHELVADTQAPSFLEKTGFNSLAFASAIEKISGTSRGVVHQGGLARASESVGTHFGINRRTSAQELQAKPDLLLGEVRQTNFELSSAAYQAEDRKKMTQILERLHPIDLSNAYRQLSALRDYEFTGEGHRWQNKLINEDEKEIALHRKAGLEIRKILAEQGATEDEQTVILMCEFPIIKSHFSDEKPYRRFNEINDPNKIRDLALLIGTDNNRKKLDSLREKAGFSKVEGQPSHFLELLSNNLFDPASTPNARGIPINEESLLDALSSIPDFPWEKGRILTKYILTSNVESVSFLPEKTQKFLEKARQKGIINWASTEAFKGNIAHRFEFLDHAGAKHSLPEDFERAALASKILESEPIDDKIESFFADLQKTLPDGVRRKPELYYSAIENRLSDFLYKISARFTHGKEIEGNQELDSEKLLIARKIMEKLKNEQLDEPWRLRYGILTAAGIFRKDSEHFYVFLNELASPDAVSGFSPELAFFCLRPIFKKIDSFSLRDNAIISDFDRLSKLPLVQLAFEHSLFKSESIQSMRDLIGCMERGRTPIAGEEKDFWGAELMMYESFFKEGSEGLILGKTYRENLLELVRKGILEPDLEALQKCLEKTYPNGPEKTHFLRAISRKILTSDNLSFEKKLLYLQSNTDNLGPEGLSLLAEQIEDITTYKQFRSAMQKSFEAYLAGNLTTLKIAALDSVSSFFSKDFKQLFDTCLSDPNSVAKSSTDFARKWISEFTHSGYSSNGIMYDPDTDSFLIEKEGRQIFRTASELIDACHDLTPFERFAVAHKALTETNGAFSSEENKQILSQQIVDALSTQNEFVQEALRFACQKGDPKFLAFPASSMLAPLLFRSLDKTKIDMDRIQYVPFDLRLSRHVKDLPPENSIVKALFHGRREVSGFGSKYGKYPDTPFFRLSKESDEQFQELTQRLHEMLDEPKQNKKESKTAEIDPSMDAIVRGVEGSGALGVRSLQLAVQMHEFSEPVRKRLSESFDANPGLNKLLFWENLHKLSEEHPETREFVQRLHLKGYLGGGSLYTTFEAEVEDDEGKRRVAIKMLNPNSEAFLKESRSMAETVLSEVRKKGGEMSKLADMGLVLTDLSHQWCLKDINDQTFIEDDDRFKRTVEGFNAREKGTEYTIPKRAFNTYNLKAEDLALGRTVNKVLNDEQVPDETKQILVERMSKFFAFQLKGPKVQEEGENYALVHSDPHVGNYIVDIKNPDMPIAIIDRHMYLKLESQDISVLEQFIAGNDLRFLLALTERVLEVNKVANRIERTVTATRVNSALMKNYFSQKSEGKVDKFSLLRAALSEFQKRGLDVPLNLRLMIRNIQALKNLTSKYGLNFEKIYRNFKP